MSKIQVVLDATKLRNLVSKRTYKNREGKEVQVQEVKFELVQLKEPKEIYKKDNMRLVKTHFACVIQTKEEREAKAPTVYIGEGITTFWGSDEKTKNINVVDAEILNTEEENDDLPF